MAGSQTVNGCVLILLLLHGVSEMGEQICYCFSFFGCDELYFMGDEEQILLYKPFCFTCIIISFGCLIDCRKIIKQRNTKYFAWNVRQINIWHGHLYCSLKNECMSAINMKTYSTYATSPGSCTSSSLNHLISMADEGAQSLVTAYLSSAPSHLLKDCVKQFRLEIIFLL